MLNICTQNAVAPALGLIGQNENYYESRTIIYFFDNSSEL
jgi:hypothetical protein